MPTLIVHTDSEPGEAARMVSGRIEVWLAARVIRSRVLPLDSPVLAVQAIRARALVGISAGADGGALALSAFFRQLPGDALAGNTFLWVHTGAQDANGEAVLGGFWLAAQRAGIAMLLRPVHLADLRNDACTLSDNDNRRLNGAMVALVESLGFCRRLKQQQASLDLAERFSVAPLLA